MALVTLPRQYLADANGRPRAGAKAYFYQAGTTTEITVYQDPDYSTAHTNPVETTSDGIFPAIYVNPGVNPTYKIVITDADDVAIYTEDNIPALGHPAEPFYPRTSAETAAGLSPSEREFVYGDLRRYSGVPDGTTDSTTALTDAAAQNVQSGGVPVIVEGGQYRITTNTTVASGVTLDFRGNGAFTVDAGKTLTINGAVIAPRRRIFYGSGTVTFGSGIGAVYPEWWGAVGDDSTDDYTALTAALANSGGRPVEGVPGRTYYIGANTLTIPASATLAIPAARIRSTNDATLSYADGAQLQGEDSRAYIGTFRAPSTLGHRIGDFLYRRRKNGEAELLVDLTPYLPAGARDPYDVNLKRYYVDPDNGDDTMGDGLAWSTAYRTVTKALQQADVDVVLCKGGSLYHLTSGTVAQFPDYSTSRDVAVIGVGAPCIMATAANITSWTQHGVLTNVYESSSTSGTVVRVVDITRRDANGDYFALTQVDSQQACHDTEDSWFYDGANVCSVNLSTGAPSTTTTLALKVSSMRVTAANAKVYIKNMHFLGGSSGAFNVRDTGGTDTWVTFEDCWFCHQYQLSGLQVLDCGGVICINCRASANGTDGFNYNDSASLIAPHFIEINCTGIGNNQLLSANGSSAHATCVGIRLNCDYFGNGGPGIHDIDTTKTLNINVTSRGQSGFTTNSGGIFASNSAEMWIDGAVCADNVGPDLVAENTSIVHMRDVYLEDGSASKHSGATIDDDFS